MPSVDITEPEDIGSNPTLRPQADVGTLGSVLVKGKASKDVSEAQEGPDDASDEDRLKAAGFTLTHGAYRRNV